MRLLCMSHSPLMLVDELAPADAAAASGFFGALEQAARWIGDYDPELVVMFAPDHFNGFFYDLMPSFCIGTEAKSTRDWRMPEKTLNVPGALAERCIDHVRSRGVDVAVSRRMKCDHGFTVSLAKLFGDLDRPPLLPVFVNCAAHPRPSFERVRLLGEAIGEFTRDLGLRTVFIGSGGLSHDPPTPRPGTPEPIPDRVIDRHTPSLEELEARQARVVQNAKALVLGGGPLLEPDRGWDRVFLDRILSQRFDQLDAYSDEEINKVAGFGGHEIRSWVAAFAAMRATGPFDSHLDYYRVVPEWITGMGVVRGATAGSL